MQSSKCNFVFILFPPICSTATDFDCILHVNPHIENRGLAMVFNLPGSTLSWNLTLVKLQEHNVFDNAPDWYFHYGTNKIGMGYDENQFSLPCWQDLSISRQSMYDDTFNFIPTQGWMQVPLVDYHGGEDAAAFEPISQHLLEYEWALAHIPLHTGIH